MGTSSSTRELVKAVADGFYMLNVTNLRKLGTSEQLRAMLVAIAAMERELRNEAISEDDFDAVRKKHFRLGNLRKARLVIQGFAKTRRIAL